MNENICGTHTGGLRLSVEDGTAGQTVVGVAGQTLVRMICFLLTHLLIVAQKQTYR